MVPRPSLSNLPQSTSSSVVPHAQPTHLYPLFANITFHVITAKLEADLARVYECIEELGGRCVGAEDALWVVTALRGRPRLVKALGRLAVSRFCRWDGI